MIVVAPATADFVGRAAHGLADDLLTACLLAAESKVLLVPAMNDRMWSHAQTKRNVAHARSLGYDVLEPATGPLAVGEGSGPGRMPEPEEIMSHVGRLLEVASSLKGKKIIVTAGATPTDRPSEIPLQSQQREDGRCARSVPHGDAALTSL